MKHNKPLKFTIVLLTIVFFVLTAALQASAFSYFVTTINNTIIKEEAAAFKLIIHNTADFEDFFTISTRNVDWIVSADPNSGLIGPDEEKEFLVKLIPKPLVLEGKTYFIPVLITSEKTGFYFEEAKKFAVYVVTPDLKSGQYIPTVVTVIDIVGGKKVDPREKVNVKVILKNLNPRELGGLKIAVNGQVFYKEYTTKLLPLEEKTNEILFEIDPITTPGMRDLVLQLFFQDKLIGESTVEYEIIGYADIQETPSKDIFLFKTTEQYDFVNNGNKAGTAEKKFRVNFFKRLFTHFTPDAAKQKASDGLKYYVVKAELGPQQTMSVKVVTDYRLLVLIISLIVLVIIFYFIFRSPVLTVKNAEPLGRTEDGLSEIKIRLYLKNRSRKPVHNLRIVDTVPSIAEIDRKTHLGSMEPVSIGKSKRGTVPRWEIDALEAYEERIISYRIKSKLTLVGGIRLPSARITFEAQPGRERTTYSNAINLLYKG
jgi:hypothetical protein